MTLDTEGSVVAVDRDSAVDASRFTVDFEAARGDGIHGLIAKVLHGAEQRVLLAEEALRNAMSRYSNTSLPEQQGAGPANLYRPELRSSPDDVVRIYMFGPFKVCREGRCIPDRAFAGRNTRTLLQILLAHRGRVVPAEVLLEALWQERLPGDAKASLSVLVSRARKALGDHDLIACSSGGYMYFDDARTWVDIEVYREVVEQARLSRRSGDLPTALRSFQQARDLWRGQPLIEHVYADWAQEFHQQFTHLHKEVLEGIAGTALELGLLPTAAEAATQLISHDRFDDAGYLLLTRVLTAQGKRSDAIHVFTEWSRWLKVELGIEPSPEALEILQAARSLEVVRAGDADQRGAAGTLNAQTHEHPGAQCICGIDRLPSPIILAEASGPITFVNAAAADLFGFPRQLSDLGLACLVPQGRTHQQDLADRELQVESGRSSFTTYHALAGRWMEWTSWPFDAQNIVLVGKEVTAVSDVHDCLRDAVVAVTAVRGELEYAMHCLTNGETSVSGGRRGPSWLIDG